MSDAILVLNAGSSSLKAGVYAIADGGPAPRARASVTGIGTRPVLKGDGGEIALGAASTGHEALLGALVDALLAAAPGGRLVAAGHRVVHGGARHDRPERVTPELMAELTGLAGLAPLHQPHNLAPIGMLERRWPGLPQTVSFDTAFHRGHERVVDLFALPRDLEARGIRRYGFHGLSYDHVSRRLADIAPRTARGRVIVAHLGNGASLCALRDGRGVDTTMGFTALDGLVMGTRCGALDPGVVLHLQRALGMSVEEVERLLYDRSGLLGVSGLSSDMRVLLASERPEAREAIDLFCHRVARETGALVATLGGLDGFVFTGGIGEHAAPIRADIARRLAWFGLALDPGANAAHATVVSPEGARVPVFVIPTDEEGVVARDCVAALGLGAAPA